jgi:hypothetical protein
MWNKIYLIALTIAVLPMLFLTYYAFSWLQSIGSPMDAIVGFKSTSNIAFYWLWISTAVLIILANALLWNDRKAWALWTTLLYLIVFLFLRSFWLEQTSNLFIASNNLPFETPILRPLLTLVIAVVAAAIVYFDQLVVTRMRDRIHPPPDAAVEPVPDPTDFNEAPDITSEENEESR